MQGSVMKQVIAIAAGCTAIWAPPALAQTDTSTKQKIIRQLIAAYPGNCRCPYNTDRAGRSCGKRSAWSRDGGYAPLCSSEDVSRADVQAFRRRGR